MNRIFTIPEIEDIIFSYLDSILDLKHIATINHHYYNKMCANKLYTNIKEFCIDKARDTTNIYISDFHRACFHNNFDVAKYIYNNSDHITRLQQIFVQCCIDGALEIVIWLSSVNSDINIGTAFEKACNYGHNDIACWLYNLDNIACIRDGITFTKFIYGNENDYYIIWWLLDLNILSEDDLYQVMCFARSYDWLELYSKIFEKMLAISNTILLDAFALSCDSNLEMTCLISNLLPKHLLLINIPYVYCNEFDIFYWMCINYSTNENSSWKEVIDTMIICYNNANNCNINIYSIIHYAYTSEYLDKMIWLYNLEFNICITYEAIIPIYYLHESNDVSLWVYNLEFEKNSTIIA
jgi:hypothetical protein